MPQLREVPSLLKPKSFLMQTDASAHEAEVQQAFQTRKAELRNAIHEALARGAATKAE